MKYKVTVRVLTEKGNEGKSYPDWDTVYEQTVEDLNLQAMIVVVNNIPSVFQITDDKHQEQEKPAGEPPA